jgi:hypothetical protein
LTGRRAAEETDGVKIHINRAGQSLGQFTPEEVRSGFDEGKFAGADLAWRDGMPMWRPLAEVIDEIAPAGVEVVPPPLVEGPAWEHRASLGFLPALGETIRGVLIEPTKTFSTLRTTGGLGAPLFFYVLVSTVGGMTGVFYQAIFQSLEKSGTPEQQAVSAMMGSAVGIGATIMLLPIFLVLGAFIGSGILHLALMMVGGAKRPFEATFRVMCYAGGATAVLQLLPGCGALIGAVWALVAQVIGLSQVHGIGKGRALVAVLLPAVLCCGLVFVLLAMVAGMMGEAAGGWSALLEKFSQP